MRGRSKLPTLLWSLLSRDWELGHLPPHGWRVRQENFCCGYRLRESFVATIGNSIETAVTNMTIKRMLENKII